MESYELIEATRSRILKEGVILCVRLDDGATALEACRAAVKGGLRVLEVTLTTPGALGIIKTLSREPGVVVGGGTVLTVDQAREVAIAGGSFVLSPVFDPRVADEAHLFGLLAIPGAASPAEVLAAHTHGAQLVKVFPSGALGGPGYLRSLRGPFPDVPLIPTSGPTADTIADYFAAGAVAVGVGGIEIFPPGFTLDHVEVAAKRVRDAIDAARG